MMSWEDREYSDATGGAGGGGVGAAGRPGGDWHGMRPSFDNPFTWSLPLLGRWRPAGISIRVHVLFLVFIVIMLLRAMLPPGQGQSTPLGFAHTAIGLASLFLLVLLHEFGHCFACRWRGGEADEIMLWPLGGLAVTQLRPRWKDHLLTAVAGPLVNLIVCVCAGVSLGLAAGQWVGVAVPNLIDPFAVFRENAAFTSWGIITLYWINLVSFVLLMFNLLPMFPLDGGRIVQAVLWARLGYSRSMMLAVNTGYVVAILLGIFGAVLSMWLVVGVAVFGGITCYLTQKQLQWSDHALEADDDDVGDNAGFADDVEVPSTLDRQSREDEHESREVDRILKKIGESGMGSLTKQERSLLQRETERKRRGGGG